MIIIFPHLITSARNYWWIEMDNCIFTNRDVIMCCQMSQQESMHSLALIRLFELHISRLKQHTIALKTNRVLRKKSAWLFSFLSSQVHTLWQHHDIKLINEDSGYSRDCIYTCINIITLHLPKLFTNTTTHCGVSKECTKLYGHLNKNYVKLQGGEFRRRIQREKWYWNSMPILSLCKFQCA